MRPFLRFFFSPSPAPPDAALAVFFAPFAPPSLVVFAGAFDAVEAGALPAVDAGFGAISAKFQVLDGCSSGDFRVYALHRGL